MLGRLTIEIEGWTIDIKKSSPTKEEVSPLNAWETRSSKTNALPLLEEAKKRRVMSCSSCLKKGGHLCRKEKNGGKEKRKGGGGSALWKVEEIRGPALYLVFGIAAGAGLGGCLCDPHRSHLRPSSESYYLVLSCPPPKLQLVYLLGSIHGRIYKSRAGSALCKE